MASPRRSLFRWIFWFLVLNLGLAILIALRYRSVAPPPATALAKVFEVGLYLGHGAEIFIILGLPLILLAALWPRRRLVWICCGFLVSLLQLVLLADTIVFQLYRFHINAPVLAMVFSRASGDIFVLSRTMYFQAAGLAAALLVMEGLAGALLWKVTQARSSFGAASLMGAVLLGALVFQHGMYCWADAVEYLPITRQGDLLPLSEPLRAKDFMVKMGVRSVDPGPARSDPASGVLDYPKQPITAQPPAHRLNILMVVIECWRFDALLEQVTPEIVSFGKRCSRFDEHFSGGNATRAGMFSLFYGIPATYWGVMLRERRGPVLISELQRQGYEFGIFGSAPLGNPEFDQTIFSTVPHLRAKSRGESSSQHDLDITQDFRTFLDRRDPASPFFSWVFYDAPHAYDYPPGSPVPFQPNWPEVNYFELVGAKDPVPVKNRYYNALHFVDGEVAKVLGSLKEHHLLESTVVVITGDHGQEFNDLGLKYWGHNGNYSRYQTKVPFLLYWPGREPRQYAHRTSHMDLAPTLMHDVLGCRNDLRTYSTGFNLFQPGGRDFLILSGSSKGAVVEPGRITLLQPFTIAHVDEAYHPLPADAGDGALLQRVLRDQAWFYRQ